MKTNKNALQNHKTASLVREFLIFGKAKHEKKIIAIIIILVENWF